MKDKYRWAAGGIVVLSLALYFWTNYRMDEERKSFKLRKVSKLNRDDLGIRKNKSKRYYELMFKFFEVEKQRLIEEGEPIPGRILQSQERVKIYLENAKNIAESD